jgi:hypothetical protein
MHGGLTPPLPHCILRLQGLTLDLCRVSLRGMFAEGQAYVALRLVHCVALPLSLQVPQTLPRVLTGSPVSVPMRSRIMLILPALHPTPVQSLPHAGRPPGD